MVSFERKLSRFGRAFCSFAFVLLGAVSSWGQARVLVTFEDEELPVVSMKGTAPVVSVGGERFVVTDGSIVVERASAYTDGAIEIVDKYALMGQDYGSSLGGFYFRFAVTLAAERDFEDCFVLFIISPEKGEQTFVLRELPDISSEGPERIDMTVPVNPGFGNSECGFKFFSRGQEILCYDSDTPLSLRMPGAVDESKPLEVERSAKRSVELGKPARALKARLLEFPKELVGMNKGGYATATYSVDENGRAFELIDMRFDNASFVPEVIKVLVGTVYQPGVFEGKPLVTTVQQRFFFNEFAPFSEEMVMVPYPTVANRNAKVIYAPFLDAPVSAPVTVKLEAVVGVLGTVREARILDDGKSDLGEYALANIGKWVFLPAALDGFPVEQKIVMPIRFLPKDEAVSTSP